MKKITFFLKTISVIFAIVITSFASNAFDTLELETRIGTEYTHNGIKYLLHHGEATVCGTVKEVEYIAIPSSILYRGKAYKVTAIGDCAFYLYDAVNGIPINPKLKNVVLPNTIAKIGDYAFAGERKLETINIPNSVQEIGIGAFQNCQKLQTIIIHERIGCIKKYTFEQCFSLKTITLPKSVKEIGHSAFMNCYNLESVKVLNPYIKINETAFIGCKKIDISKLDCEIIPSTPRRIIVVFNKDGLERQTESTAIWMLFKSKEEADKCYVGEYEYGKKQETFIKRDSLIYW